MRTLERQSASIFGSSATVRRVELRLAEGVSFANWRSLLQRALELGDSSAWWLGDILVYGEWRYGEKYRSVLEELDLAYDRARDYAYVSGNVPPAVRVAELSWMHHRAVAKLVPDEQEKWLRKGLDEGWSYRELRDAIAGALPAPEPATVLLEQVRITVDAERHARWEAAAERAHANVSDWAIAVLDVAAENGAVA